MLSPEELGWNAAGPESTEFEATGLDPWVATPPSPIRPTLEAGEFVVNSCPEAIVELPVPHNEAMMRVSFFRLILIISFSLSWACVPFAQLNRQDPQENVDEKEREAYSSQSTQTALAVVSAQNVDFAFIALSEIADDFGPNAYN